MYISMRVVYLNQHKEIIIMLLYVIYLLVTFVTLWMTNFVYRWKHPKCNGELPPGSMGIPLLGETLSFFENYDSFDVSPFVKNRMKRYGPIFKTSIVGQALIVSTDPEFNHFIFQQEGRLFQSWYPYTFTEIFGRKNMATLHGFMYKYLKSLVLSLFGVDSLKENLLPEIEKMACERLHSWSHKPSVDLKEEISMMIFDLTAKKLISYDPEKDKENFRENFVAFIEGLISFPINLLGTSYNKCMKGRKNALTTLKKMMNERRASPRSTNNDFFDHIIEELQKEKTQLTEEIALDLMFVLLFASYETTSLALTMAVKFISEHPPVQAKLLEEHQEILRKRDSKNSGITWEEYKSMTFTSQVINETVRLANIAPAIFRKPTEDIKTKDGYTIPAGWGIMVCPPAIHMNPKIYDSPTSFNPWRWKGIDTYGGSKSFMAFGGGMRFCVGADFSRLQMAIFLHHLIVKYRFITIKGGEILRTPGLNFPNGYHVKLIRKNE